jgi:Domain of unknown function (DUF222)
MFGSVIEPIKALREATDDLTSQDLDRLFDDQISAAAAEVAILENRLTAMRLRLIAEADRRRLSTMEGHASAASWVADRCRLSYGQARTQLGLAHDLERMPHTAAAFIQGDLDITRVRRLSTANATNPELFARDETVLIESARTLTPRQFATAVDYWRQNSDRDRFEEEANDLYQQRHLHISRTFGGMIRIDADLDPESGDIVATALRSLVEPAARDGDERTAPQRRSDAITEICRYWLDYADTPTHGGRRPHLAVIVDYRTLVADDPGRCELDDGTVITAETARRLACDAGISRIITNGPSQILDVGRITRTIPPASRLALDIRDRHCTWPGCDRPPRLCDAHHIQQWQFDGHTDLDNLTLYCRPHHRLAHRIHDRPP